ncbi:hypothetical protein Sjap_025175 [Stephania japonica]|uniref:Uncharacterized protein n=1 Tax=Stephania japonica TaxID=461633 RepID=A0AAP0HFC1_9MAGN
MGYTFHLIFGAHTLNSERTLMANASSGPPHHLTYAFDAGFLSGAPPPDSPTSTVDSPRDADPESRDSPREPNQLTDLRACLRVFTESYLRMEAAEMEMIKSREASRIEAERRRAETESVIAHMLARNQVQIAEFLARKSRNRKRKRVQRDDLSVVDRQGLLLLWLLQSNLDF